MAWAKGPQGRAPERQGAAHAGPQDGKTGRTSLRNPGRDRTGDGDAMGMTGFSDAEMALLSGLDAVAWVTRTRITYTDSFKREAVTRYRQGESPVRIFREAGLDPRIIGNKRIERCIARWKREPPDAGTTRPHAPAADAGREGRPAPMSVVLAQTMRINALEERLRRLELSLADGTTR